MRPLRSFFLIAVLLSPVICLSQDTISVFNQYYQRSVEKLRDLYNVRGAAFVCERIQDPYREVNKMMSDYDAVSGQLGVVFYSFNNDSLQVWLLKKGSLTYHYRQIKKETLVQAEVDIRKALKVDLLLAARDAKNRGVTINKKDEVVRPEIGKSIETATDYLLPPPIAAKLEGLKHLIIIPEFNISQFPLYLLKPYKNDSYLIDSVSISIAPHLCNLAVTLKDYERYIGKPLAMSFDNPLVVGNPSYSTEESFNLSPLPGAEAEADTIASILHTRALKGKEATLSTILKKARTSDLLYFATHGYADLENGLAGSFLAFAPDSMSTTGLWNAKSIQEQDLKGRSSMAILSACQTGVGKIYDAGFIGIGRAFYKAGIDHTIMSLWSVDDAATRSFMTLFVKTLITAELHFYPAGHLRKTILEFKKEDPDPVHWAPFMLFGFPY